MIWAVGDIQGCFRAFKKLLKEIDFNPKKDRLWIAGDLVNRGENSLDTLLYLYSIKDSIEVVLGNHDIALIASYYGIKKGNSSIEPILKHPKAKELIDWLSSQKFLHIDKSLGYCMAHAGISPEFDLGMAIEYSKRIENKLQSSEAKVWLKKMFKHSEEKFNRYASDLDIDRYILSSFVQMRYCHKDSKLDFKQKGKPTEGLRKKDLKPWFESEFRRDIDLKIIFGHWSTLGFFNDENVLALDTGCLWGNKLTTAKIDSKELKIVSVD